MGSVVAVESSEIGSRIVDVLVGEAWSPVVFSWEEEVCVVVGVTWWSTW